MSDSKYTIHTYDDGSTIVKAVTTWNRRTGKNQTSHHCRESEIHTQSKFKAWAKRNNINITQDEIDMLPKKVWWQ